MQIYDIIMLLVLVGAVAYGAWKGLAWQIASLAALIVSYFVAVRFRLPLAERIEAPQPWNVFAAMLILYLATSLVIWLGFRMVKGFIDKLKLKDFDHQVGALVGGAKGVLLCVVITLFAITLLKESQQQAIVTSRSGYYIAVLLDSAHGVMPPEVHEVLHPYIHKLDEKVGQEHSDGGVAHEEADRASEQPSLLEVP